MTVNTEAWAKKIDLQGTSDDEIRILIWRDRYVTCLEHQMVRGFAQLEKSILHLLSDNFASLLPWRSREFVETVVTEEIQRWMEKIVLPVLNEANEEYLLVSRANCLGPTPNLEIPLGSAVLKVMTLPVGAMVVGAGLSVGVSAKGMTVVVLAVGGSAAAMPAIALGAGAVGALMALGATGLWSIKEQVVKRLGKAIIPTLKRSLVGDSYQVREVMHSSVLRNLQKLIKDRASEMIAAEHELKKNVDYSI